MESNLSLTLSNPPYDPLFNLGSLGGVGSLGVSSSLAKDFFDLLDLFDFLSETSVLVNEF
jgi:hypothetical protein